jgi:hypothetical protein
VTPNGKYFIMLEEGTVGRLTKYIDMQDIHGKMEGIFKVLLFYDVYNNIFFNIILYLPTSSCAK